MSRLSYYSLSLWQLLTGFEEPWRVLRLFFAPRRAATTLVAVRGGPRLEVRTALDAWIVKETFLDRFYTRYGTPVGAGWRVLDVGAGLGDFALLAAAAPGAEVHAFEPYPGSYALLQRNLARNHATNVTPHPQAVAGTSGRLTLDAGREPVQIGAATAEARAPFTASALSLGDALSVAGVETCALLKLDCEGAEFAILQQAPSPVLARVARIVMEVHEGPGRRRETLLTFLQAQGYQTRACPNPVHRELGFIYAERTANT